MRSQIFVKAFLLSCALLLSGCELPVQEMGPRERGVIFRRLPTFLGGGVSRSVAQGGALVYVMPWDSVARIDTGTVDVQLGEGSGSDLSGFVFTRAKDGNEVALRMTIRYRVTDNPEILVRLVQEVGKSNEEIRNLVLAISRAEIRRYMNELRTSEFLRDTDRYRGVETVQKGIQRELDLISNGGVEVLALMLDRFEFARLLPDGTTDRSYQDKLNESLRILEEMEQEQLRIATVKAEGEQREFQAQAAVNRLEQEALGIKEQAELSGLGYLTKKQNEAKGILALGRAEVDGLREQINALEGPGGAAILKLDLARYLQESDPRFVVLGNSGTSSATANAPRGLELQRLDANQLLDQMGVFEALKDSNASQSRRDALLQKKGSADEEKVSGENNNGR